MVNDYLRRSLWLFGGLLLSAVGVVMMLQANVGLEPWSVLQQGIAQTTGMTYGTASILVGAAVILIAVLCGESFGMGTVSNIIFCGIFIDAILWLDWIPLQQSLWSGLLLLVAGLELLALGTWMYLKSGLGAGPRDSLMVALARRTGRSVGLCRAVIDVIVIVVGYFLGGQVGVGTVVAALGLGPLINLTFRVLRFKAVEVEQENAAETIRKFKNRT